MRWRLRRKLSEVLRVFAYKLAGSPKFVSVPDYRNHKLVGYEEFKLNDIGLAYMDDDLRRYIFLFNTQLSEVTND